MSILFLSNIGLQDVLLAGQRLASQRQDGERLLADYAHTADQLSIPILQADLHYLLSRHPKGIDQVVLFGTDQQNAIHRANDTLYSAELARRRILELFPGQVRQAQVVLVQGISPAEYDEALEKFDELLDPWSRQEWDTCYASLAGGIPACNAALLFQGVRHFRERLEIIYPPKGGEPHTLRAGQQVLLFFNEAAAIEHLRRLDFANALPYLEKLEAAPVLVCLARYAAERLAFNFEAAQAALEQAIQLGRQADREFIQDGLRHQLDLAVRSAPLDTQGLLALLVELYWNAVITYQHRRYADFLGRVYRFQEAILRFIVETLFNLATDLSPEVQQVNQQAWESFITGSPALLAYLENVRYEGRQLDWRIIARPTYKAMLSFALQRPPGSDPDAAPAPELERWKAIFNQTNGLDSLVTLRHRTIIGHGFQGVSEDMLRAAYKSGRLAPPDGLAEIMRALLKHKPEPNPYQQIADYLCSRLSR
jgi:hypothetical protein